MKLFTELRKHLMFGMAAVIPVVAVGSLLVTVSALTADARYIGYLSGIAALIDKLSANTFTMVTTVISAAIAYSVAGKYAIIPGMIGGLLADAISIDASGVDINYVGGIFSGFISGYVVKSLQGRIMNNGFAALKHVLILPLLSVLVCGFLMYFVIGDPTAYFVACFRYLFVDAPFWLMIVSAAVFGAMLAFDIGGPVSKFVFLTAAVLVIQFRVYNIMGPVAAALSVPSLAAGIYALARPSGFGGIGRSAGMWSIVAALFGLPEGALAFLPSSPVRLIAASSAGAAVAGAVAAVLRVSVMVPFGGIIAIPMTSGVYGYLAAIACGTVISLVILLSTGKNTSK